MMIRVFPEQEMFADKPKYLLRINVSRLNWTEGPPPRQLLTLDSYYKNLKAFLLKEKMKQSGMRRKVIYVEQLK